MWRHRVEHSAACFAQFDCNGVGLVQLDGPAYVLDALFLFFVFFVLCAGATGWPCVLDVLFFFFVFFPAYVLDALCNFVFDFSYYCTGATGWPCKRPRRSTALRQV